MYIAHVDVFHCKKKKRGAFLVLVYVVSRHFVDSYRGDGDDGRDKLGDECQFKFNTALQLREHADCHLGYSFNGVTIETTIGCGCSSRRNGDL